MLLRGNTYGATIHQVQLEQVVASLFPSENVISNARKDIAIKNPETGSYLEYDVWVPSLSLGFEFQDIHHYITTWYYNEPLPVVQARDSLKVELSLSSGITSIFVPCWWDTKPESLQETIHTSRPDLIGTAGCLPIPLNVPSDYLLFQKKQGISGLGELMLASFMPSDTFFQQDISSLNPWWMGEKYDGVRCVWHPSKRSLYSRTGKELYWLPEYKYLMPSSFLDAEVWFGRGMYLECSRIVAGSFDVVNWDLLRLAVFDDPSNFARDLPYEERYSGLIEILGSNHPFLTLVARVLCQSKFLVQESLQKILSNEGEGILLRKPRSLYESGRSTNLLKLKAARGDSEALVVEIQDHSHILLQLPSGITFKVPPHHFKYLAKPKVGDVVTFEYESFSRSDIPKNPKICRIRKDVEWEDVLRNHARDAAQAKHLNDQSQRVLGFSAKKAGYWTAEKGKNMRKFLEDFAKKSKFDPLIPDNWYRISKEDISQYKGAESIFFHFKGGYKKALMFLFPDIGFDESKFANLPGRFYADLNNRREVFNTFARKHGFDPLEAENWYEVSRQDILATKGAERTMKYYDRSFVNALIHLYPDVGFDRVQFLEDDSVPDIGELMRPSKLQAPFTEEILASANWWMGEKHYSIRCVWNPIKETLYSRNGQVIKLPEVYTFQSPAFFEGEIWIGRDFLLDSRALLPTLTHRQWQVLRVIAYDNPDVNFQNLPYEKRYKLLLGTIPSDHPFILPAPSVKCLGELHLKSHMKFIGGEGVTLRKVKSVYTPGRPDYFFHIRVEGHGPRKWEPPKLKLNFFARFARDAGFDPLIPNNWYTISNKRILAGRGVHSMLSKYLNFVDGLLKIYPNIGLEKNKFWAFNHKPKFFFQKFAKSYGFDPLVAKNWYLITEEQVKEFEDGSIVLRAFRNSLPRALSIVFPDIGINKIKFHGNYWKLDVNRRIFFDEIARKNNFDPLVSANWYNIEKSQIYEFQNAPVVLSYHHNNYIRALCELYRDVGLQRMKFKGFFNSLRNRRYFFEKLAKIRGFDPLVAANWYKFTRDSFDSDLVLSYHNGSVADAICDLFPNIGADKRKFVEDLLPHIAKGRSFFNKYARQKEFDPFIPQNWYSADREDIIAQKGSSILFPYKYNVLRALNDFYPNLNLDETFNSKKPNNHWASEQNRRIFFESLAKAKNCDPLVPETWYSRFTRSEIRDAKGGYSVLSFYTNCKQALVALFPDISLDKDKLFTRKKT